MFKLKKIAFLSFFFLALTFLVTSCDEDTLQESITPDANPAVETRLGDLMARALPPDDDGEATGTDSLCFTFNFPLSFLREDGTTVTFENEDALYEMDTEADDIADFVYPFSVTLADGTITTVDEFEDFIAVLEECFGDFDFEDGDYDDDYDDDFELDEDCFEPVFPITFTVNEESLTFNTDQELEDFLDGLDDDDEELDIELVFPVSVRLVDTDSVIVLNSEEDLDLLIITCGDYDDDDDDDDDDYDHGDCPDDFDFAAECFVPVFPFTIALDDEEITFEDSTAFEEFLLELDEDDVEFDLVYPFSVLLVEDGEILEITNEEELFELIFSCGFDDFEDGDFDLDDDCITLNFPLQLSINGTPTDDLESIEAMVAAWGAALEMDAEVDFVYPISVTLAETGETVSVEDAEAFEELLDNCDD